TYTLEPRGPVLCLPATSIGAQLQLGACLATGNKALFVETGEAAAHALVSALPRELAQYAQLVSDTAIDSQAQLGGVLYEGDSDGLVALGQRLAARPGPIVLPQGLNREELEQGRICALDRLLAERSVSVNTAAA